MYLVAFHDRLTRSRRQYHILHTFHDNDVRMRTGWYDDEAEERKKAEEEKPTNN